MVYGSTCHDVCFLPFCLFLDPSVSVHSVMSVGFRASTHQSSGWSYLQGTGKWGEERCSTSCCPVWRYDSALWSCASLRANTDLRIHTDKILSVSKHTMVSGLCIVTQEHEKPLTKSYWCCGKMGNLSVHLLSCVIIVHFRIMSKEKFQNKQWTQRICQAGIRLHVIPLIHVL